MTTRPQDLFLMPDGTQAEPSDVSPGKDGVLRHKNGMAVCMTEDGRPMTIGMTSEANKNAANAGKDPAAKRDGSLLMTTTNLQDVKVGEQNPAAASTEPKVI